MNEQSNKPTNEILENIAEQNKKMRKKLLIILAVTIGAILLLMTVLLIVKACQKDDEPFALPDGYFHPTHRGDIFEYNDYLEKSPEVILYCEDSEGRGH